MLRKWFSRRVNYSLTSILEFWKKQNFMLLLSRILSLPWNLCDQCFSFTPLSPCQEKKIVVQKWTLAGFITQFIHLFLFFVFHPCQVLNHAHSIYILNFESLPTCTVSQRIPKSIRFLWPSIDELTQFNHEIHEIFDRNLNSTQSDVMIFF